MVYFQCNFVPWIIESAPLIAFSLPPTQNVQKNDQRTHKNAGERPDGRGHHNIVIVVLLLHRPKILFIDTVKIQNMFDLFAIHNILINCSYEYKEISHLFLFILIQWA